MFFSQNFTFFKIFIIQKFEQFLNTIKKMMKKIPNPIKKTKLKKNNDNEQQNVFRDS